MRCPFCDSPLNKVVDKRAVKGLGEIRRRRECLKCSRRFTTYERIGNLEFLVIKKDGRREPFNKEKIRAGLAKALEKRPSLSLVDDLTNKIERKIRAKRGQEVTTKSIGRMVLSELKKLDMVAYLRFASVYRQFEQPEDFTKEVRSLVS
ncbi:MAG: Transcriptional repressor NrdR [Candidatus Daviesbacteria bacterium GW2011_GWA1_41_61]|nr:MAG: Transcriptional repressor NrdR [Candidatus Daviesbacteria bacterium GW2011_GWC1_40_9]KKR93068.1 MAG: Transcriptional repressor NrdR [Candidatus Daviesbacteria bacterium GW2011_GWB1_41_15]KKS15612.1 MAG: Transcriptional repressor NrdR [Candidatus Daviesbacteria bacterium GW2011_GWA1_41_61]